MESNKKFTLYHDDCLNVMKSMDTNSIDFIVTDPPYFIDGMGDEWSDSSLTKKAINANVIGGLPVGMKFDREQGYKLQEFMTPIAKEYFRILKPGGFCVVFSQARLYHRMAIAIEDAGFEMRDMMGWKYEGQAKAFSQDHFIKKNKSLSDKEKEELLHNMKGWKTPQLKPQIEPMTLAQKPREGTFIDNWSKYGVGLLNTTISLDGMFPGNIMEVSKQEKFHDEDYKIEHFTTKPVKLIEHIIKLFTQKGQIVFDSFCGSGSHGVAALRCGRKFIGVEREEKYFDIASKRMKNVQSIEDFYE